VAAFCSHLAHTGAEDALLVFSFCLCGKRKLIVFLGLSAVLVALRVKVACLSWMQFASCWVCLCLQMSQCTLEKCLPLLRLMYI
jgi:hypothetical protein